MRKRTIKKITLEVIQMDKRTQLKVNFKTHDPMDTVSKNEAIGVLNEAIAMILDYSNENNTNDPTH